jgi:hypothetical protein
MNLATTARSLSRQIAIRFPRPPILTLKAKEAVGSNGTLLNITATGDGENTSDQRDAKRRKISEYCSRDQIHSVLPQSIEMEFISLIRQDPRMTEFSLDENHPHPQPHHQSHPQSLPPSQHQPQSLPIDKTQPLPLSKTQPLPKSHNCEFSFDNSQFDEHFSLLSLSEVDSESESTTTTHGSPIPANFLDSSLLVNTRELYSQSNGYHHDLSKYNQNFTGYHPHLTVSHPHLTVSHPHLTGYHPHLTGYNSDLINSPLKSNRLSPPPSPLSAPSSMPSPAPSPTPLHTPLPSLFDLQQTRNSFFPPNENDWTAKFYALRCISDVEERAERLDSLISDFRCEVDRVVRLLAEEWGLSSTSQSLRPLRGFGVAGGRKYSENFIFFKCGVDEDGLYGGHDNAMKVCGHEMKGITSYASSLHPSLYFPLTCVIDYCGLRVIASSVIPISPQTLVYGSRDGGRTVIADENVGEWMNSIASHLNLKGHLAGLSHQQYLYGPCDQEIHKGYDNRYYAIDLARVCPPETPQPNKKGAFLYRLLRPEFVENYGTPLSSDAFSLFGSGPTSEVNDRDIRIATQYLLTELLPRTAAWLSSHPRFHSPPDISQMKWLVRLLHLRGVNLRYLGALYGHCKNETVRNIILTEMTTRALKHILNGKLRAIHHCENKSRDCMQTFFNDVFGSGMSSELLWGGEIQMRLREYFSFESPWNLRDIVSLHLLYLRLQSLTHIRLAPLNIPRGARPFLDSDILQMKLKQKFSYAIAREEVICQLEAAKQNRKYLQNGLKWWSRCLKLKSNDISLLSHVGNTLSSLALATPHTHKAEAQILFSRSSECFEMWAAASPTTSEPYSKWIDILLKSILYDAVLKRDTKLIGHRLTSSELRTRFAEVHSVATDAIEQITNTSEVAKLGHCLLTHAQSITSSMVGVHPILHIVAKESVAFFTKQGTKSLQKYDLFMANRVNIGGEIERMSEPTSILGMNV